MLQHSVPMLDADSHNSFKKRRVEVNLQASESQSLLSLLGSAFGAVAVIDGKANFRKPPLAQPDRNPKKPCSSADYGLGITRYCRFFC